MLNRKPTFKTSGRRKNLKEVRIKMSELRQYKCVFDKDQNCPVKLEYKLKPESLVEFCKVCKTITKAPTAEFPQLFVMLLKMANEEKERIRQENLELTKMIIGSPRMADINVKTIKEMMKTMQPLIGAELPKKAIKKYNDLRKLVLQPLDMKINVDEDFKKFIRDYIMRNHPDPIGLYEILKIMLLGHEVKLIATEVDSLFATLRPDTELIITSEKFEKKDTKP